jgi:hypothetical protein
MRLWNWTAMITWRRKLLFLYHVLFRHWTMFQKVEILLHLNRKLLICLFKLLLFVSDVGYFLEFVKDKSKKSKKCQENAGCAKMVWFDEGFEGKRGRIEKVDKEWDDLMTNEVIFFGKGGMEKMKEHGSLGMRWIFSERAEWRKWKNTDR